MSRNNDQEAIPLHRRPENQPGKSTIRDFDKDVRGQDQVVPGVPLQGQDDRKCRCSGKEGDCHCGKHEEGTPCDKKRDDKHAKCKGKKRREPAHDSASTGQSEEGSDDRTAALNVSTRNPGPVNGSNKRAKRGPGRPPKNHANATTSDPLGFQSLTTKNGNPVTLLPCKCVRGGKCYRKDHLEGESCTNFYRKYENDRHRTCNDCRKKKPLNSVPNRRETRSDEDGATSQDSGGEFISDESLKDGDDFLDFLDWRTSVISTPLDEWRLT